jgi:orotidine-5'-phosphate decarboxylase
MTRSFAEKLQNAQLASESWLCVGLDPVMERLPVTVQSAENPFLAFGRAIVESTADLVCAYKPNLGFWLAGGISGLRGLEALIRHIPGHLPVILDAKFGDVGHTVAAYAKAAFDWLGADAVTANPYLGLDGLKPFLERADRGAFVLARTSNPSARDLQDRAVGGGALFEEVARLADTWHADFPGICGLVVGATYPAELTRLRELAPDLPFLVPGIGAQGGSLAAAVTHGPTAGGIGPVINSSRGIIYASPGPDFAAAAREAARELRERINFQRENA